MVSTVFACSDALAGSTVSMKTLDGRVKNIAIMEVVHPGYSKRLHGLGMPLMNGDRGEHTHIHTHTHSHTDTDTNTHSPKHIHT